MSAVTETATRVTFRKFTDVNDELLAVFLDSHDARKEEYNSYMFAGQHAPCDDKLDVFTTPATEAEYAPMKRELESIGYTLEIV